MAALLEGACALQPAGVCAVIPAAALAFERSDWQPRAWGAARCVQSWSKPSCRSQAGGGDGRERKAVDQRGSAGPDPEFPEPQSRGEAVRGLEKHRVSTQAAGGLGGSGCWWTCILQQDGVGWARP